MKVLTCHNYYQQRGGEDQSFEDEVALLRQHGHAVVTYTRHNDEINAMSRLGVAQQTLWNRRSVLDMRRLLAADRPDVVHVTNTFPLISPSVYREANRAGVPVVQALRNYRMGCANACFLRDARVCEKCLGKRAPWPAVVHRCYRRSLAGSLVVAGMQTLHHSLGTWTRGVDAFYTLTEFARQKCVEIGLPADRVLVKPNCVQPDPGPGDGEGGYAVFVGRLSPEKGVDTLLEAWSALGPEYPLRIVGGGPLQGQVEAFAAGRPHVEWLGPLAHADVLRVVGSARLLVMPSRWYETFGRTIIEAYAKGTPVVASRLGAMAELVREERTGLLFDPADAAGLAAAVRRVWGLPQEPADRWRQWCREEYVAHYTPETNYEHLLKVYEQASVWCAARRRSAPSSREAARAEATSNPPGRQSTNRNPQAT